MTPSFRLSGPCPTRVPNTDGDQSDDTMWSSPSSRVGESPFSHVSFSRRQTVTGKLFVFVFRTVPPSPITPTTVLLF